MAESLYRRVRTRALLWLGVCCWLGFWQLAQADTRVVRLSEDSQETLRLEDDVAILEDPGGNLPIEQVTSPAFAARFGYAASATLPAHGVHFARIDFDNQTGKARSFILQSYSAKQSFSFVTVYSPSATGYMLVTAGGNLAPFPSYDLGIEQPGCALLLAPGRSAVYIRMQYPPHQQGDKDLLARLWKLQTHASFEGYVSVSSTLEGVVIGILLIMVFYNLSLYYSSAAREYFWLSLWALGGGLFCLYGSQFAHNLGRGVFENEAALRRFMSVMNFISVSLIVVSGTRFLCTYLSIEKGVHPLRRVLDGVAYLIVCMLVLRVLFYTRLLFEITMLVNGLLVCMILLSVYVTLEQTLRGAAAARLFLITNGVVMIGALGHILGVLATWSGKLQRDNPFVDNLFFLGLALQLSLLSISATKRVREVRRERELSDRLLNEVLPPSIAARLKTGETGIAEHFDSVTVLFADIVGFTPLSAELSPERVVETLNSIFSRFDDLTRRYGLEKIKTIGDCYMVVAGLPVRRRDHQQVIAEMSLQLLDSLEDYQREAHRTGKLAPDKVLQMRIGVHCGPVVAGVIGTRKFAYDLWGDTVNIASRMESHGEPGKIHCTQAFQQALGSAFVLESRGELSIKGKGTMKTFFLVGRAHGDETTGSPGEPPEVGDDAT